MSSLLPIVALAVGLANAGESRASAVTGVKNVVLVHGGFVDGSGWEAVYRELKRSGYSVSVVQNPTTSLADDVAVTKRVLAGFDGPAILVGHSYGGVVITEAGNDPKVAGLVYIAAFAPDSGESVSTLIKDPPPGAPVPPILPPQDGYLFLDKARFAASFAADVPPGAAAFMADSQVPWGVEALNGAVGQAAWKTQAQLVPGGHGGPDDPARRPEVHVQAGQLHRRRGEGQPRRLRVPAAGGGGAHPEGRRRGAGSGHPPLDPEMNMTTRKRLHPLLGLLLVLAGCGDGSTPPSGTAVATFSVAGETFRVQLVGDQIDAAQAAQAGGPASIPSGRIVAGGGVNQGWSWHLEEVGFAEAAIELCDGRPSDVERQGVQFGGGRFCPWSARVVSIDTAD